MDSVIVALVGLFAELTDRGVNVAVTPAGKPLALRLAVISAPLPLNVTLTVYVADEPGQTGDGDWPMKMLTV